MKEEGNERVNEKRDGVGRHMFPHFTPASGLGCVWVGVCVCVRHPLSVGDSI